MDDNELKEISRYFILCTYRDGDYMLLDEYEELEDIIKRNKTAQHLEDIRYMYLRNYISQEEYDNICNGYYKKLGLIKDK